MLSDARLDREDCHVVSDEVVEFASDVEPFLCDAATRFLFPGHLGPLGALDSGRDDLCPAADCVTGCRGEGGPGDASEERSAEDPVGGEEQDACGHGGDTGDR